MTKVIELVWSWFGARALPVDPPPCRIKQRKHLPIQIQRQLFNYSCVPAVLSTVYEYFSGRRLPHSKAILLTACDRDGALLDSVPKVMAELCGTSSKVLRSLGSVRHVVRSGCPVISNDSVTYGEDHAVLIVGATKSGFYIADPSSAEIGWRSDSWVKQAADEFIAIFPPRLPRHSIRVIKK